MGDSLGGCDHEIEFQVLAGVRKKNSKVKIFIQETVVWGPMESSS